MGRFDELDQIILRYVGSGVEGDEKLLGAAFVVNDDNGGTLYSNAFGKLNFEPNSPAFTTDSVCWIASMTKLATAVSVMQLVEKGMVTLTEDVGKYLPQLSNMDILQGFDAHGAPIMTKQTKPITLIHLLTHSSGLAYGLFDPEIMKWLKATGRTPKPFSLDACTLPLKFEPGDGWVYGVGPDWVGQIVEILTGVTFEDYMKKNIFVPLGMSSTTFRLAERTDLKKRLAAVGRRSVPHGRLSAGPPPVPERPGFDSGGGGLFSTASDYAKFLRAILISDHSPNKILKPETIRELLRPRLTDEKYLARYLFGDYHDMMFCEYPPGLRVNYSLGGAVNMETVPGKRRESSIMWSGMPNTHWWIDPRTGISATLVTQVLPPGDAVAASLYDELENAVYSQLLDHV